MIDVGSELILFERGRDDRNDLAALVELRAASAAVYSVGSGRNQVRSVGELGLEQRPGDRIDGAEVHWAVYRIPNGGGEVVDAGVRAIVGERPRQQHGVARLVDEGGLGLGSLIGAEEERLVAHDRSADGAPAFIALQDRLVDAGSIEEEVVGHQRVALVVEIAAAAETVRAALGDEGEISPAIASG